MARDQAQEEGTSMGSIPYGLICLRRLRTTPSHSPSRQEQLVDFKISDLPLAGVKNTPASHKMAQTPGLICETFQGWWRPKVNFGIFQFRLLLLKAENP